MNTDASWPDLDEAESRVLKIQPKLHQWATDSPDRRFEDLFNLVADPADRVISERGNRSGIALPDRPARAAAGRPTVG